MKESDIWPKVRRALPSETYWTRIEDRSEVGIADVNLSRRGVEVWIEGKVIKKVNPRMVDIKLKTTQGLWLAGKKKSGSNVYILVFEEDSQLWRVIDSGFERYSKPVSRGFYLVNKTVELTSFLSSALRTASK